MHRQIALGKESDVLEDVVRFALSESVQQVRDYKLYWRLYRTFYLLVAQEVANIKYKQRFMLPWLFHKPEKLA